MAWENFTLVFVICHKSENGWDVLMGSFSFLWLRASSCWDFTHSYIFPRKEFTLKKLKLSSNFVDFKQTIIPAGDCFNEEWFFAMSTEGISQRATSDFL